MHDRCLIIGAGQAGLSAAQALREQGFQGAIVLAGAEAASPYQRPPLSKKVLSGEMTAERLALKPEAFFTAHQIDWRGHCTIEDVDLVARRARFSGGTLPFDRLILATGTAARALPLADLPKQGIFSLRSIADVERLRPQIASGRRLLIIGAGYIGLEVAAVALSLGASVTVIEAAPRVLARSVGPEISQYFETLHRARGVVLVLHSSVQAIERGPDGLIAHGSAGQSFVADAILVGIGSQPLTALAQAAGLAVDDGVVVNQHCQTSAEAVWAAGDCTRFFSARYQRSLRLESVQNAIDQARSAAANMTDHAQIYDPLPWFWSDQYEVKLQIAGLAQGHDQVVLRGDPEQHRFSAFYFVGKKLIAADSVNSPRDHMLARRVIGREIAGEPGAMARLDISHWETLFAG